MVTENDFCDLSTEGQIVARLVQSGATNNALGFLVRQLRADGYSSRMSDLHLGIDRYRSDMPACFHEQEVDTQRTRKMVDAMSDGTAEMMSGLAAAFAQRKAVKAAMAKA